MKKYVLLIIIMMIFTVSCTSKNVTLDNFLDKARDNGYIIRSDKSGYEAYEKIKSVTYAINQENAYDIQFLELIDDDYAHKFFLLNKDEIKDMITSSDYLKTKSLSNYELCHAENDTKYLLVIRSNTNIIYIDAPISYINEIEEFLADLNLEY